MSNKKVSVAVIKRLPKYYRYLGTLLDNNVVRISSKELSQHMNTTSSQIRQDLNNFGCFGQQGYGYNVPVLYAEIRKILGLDNSYNVIVIGAGNLGKAILNFSGFERRGIVYTAVFDSDPQKIGAVIHGIVVQDITELDKFLEDNQVDIAVLATPKDTTQSICTTLANAGVPAIWNFAPFDIKVPETTIVENVHLSDSLMTLFYRLNEDWIFSQYVNN